MKSSETPTKAKIARKKSIPQHSAKNIAAFLPNISAVLQKFAKFGSVS
jgi:hypothetical protein